MKCANCGRKSIVEGEGHWIKGDWARDSHFEETEYYGKWVCCYGCYEELAAKIAVKDDDGWDAAYHALTGE